MPVYKDKVKTKDGRQFYYTIHYVDQYYMPHRIKSKRYLTKKDAEKAEAKKLLELDKLPTETMTFSQAALAFCEEKKKKVKPGSYKAFENALNHALLVLGDIQIDKLTNKQYEAFLSHLDNFKRNGKLITNKSKKRSVTALNQLLDFTNKRYNLTTSVPSRYDSYKVETPKEMKYMTVEQFEKLDAVIDDIVYSALFTTLFYMGLRIGEANRLQWKHITDTITIKQTVSTKLRDDKGSYLITSPKTSTSNRTLPIPQIVSRKLLELREYYSKWDEFSAEWFVFGGLKPLPESTIQKAKHRYFKAADLDEIRLHDFRHSCASFLINNGASPLLVSKWLGHSSVTMTLNRYSHLYKSELLEIVKEIDKKCT